MVMMIMMATMTIKMMMSADDVVDLDLAYNAKPKQMRLNLHTIPGTAEAVRQDSVSEWLRRWTRNPLGSARRGSNPLAVVLVPLQLASAAYVLSQLRPKRGHQFTQKRKTAHRSKAATRGGSSVPGGWPRGNPTNPAPQNANTQAPGIEPGSWGAELLASRLSCFAPCRGRGARG
jgi:hypothetical protein